MKRRAITGLVLGFSLLAAVHAGAQGGEAVVMPAGDIPEVLRARVGKAVHLVLRSGKAYGGTVGEVRDQSVVLKGLSGKEFYDAIVRLDDVSAVEIRNR
jgi:hypothetical protein